MATLDFKTALRKLELIYNECSPEAQKKKEDEAKLDDFGKHRKSIHRNIKEIRKLIKDRDESLGRIGLTSGTTSRESAEASFKIRMKIKAVKEEVVAINEILKKEEKELGKLKSAGGGDQKYKAKQDAVTTHREVADLINRHVEEVESLEKRRYTDKMNSGDKAALFSSSTGGSGAGGRISPDNARAAPSLADQAGLTNPKLPYKSGAKGGSGSGTGGSGASGGGISGGSGGGAGGDSELPDIDVEEDLKMIQDKNNLIDQDLDQIAIGVGNLKEIAQGMNRELDNQNELLEKIENRVVNANTKLENINVRMKNSIEKVMKGDRFLVNCILLVILLSIAAAIATQLTNKKK